MRCGRANHYGMPAGLFAVLQATRGGRQIVVLLHTARTPEVAVLPQHP